MSQRNHLTIAITAFGLGACASDASHVQDGTPWTVIEGKSVYVVNVETEDQARPFAHDVCAKLGRAAIFNSVLLYRPAQQIPQQTRDYSAVQFDCAV
jgi:hypothetical protein